MRNIPFLLFMVFNIFLSTGTTFAIPKEIKRDGNFTLYDNGVVNDSNTGLEWFVGPEDNPTWDDAKKWVENITLADGGWRMPVRGELKSPCQEGAGELDMTPLIPEGLLDGYRIPEIMQTEKNEKDRQDTEEEPQATEEGVQLKNDSEESESKEEEQRNSENADLNSILIEEVRKGNIEAVRGLLSIGADADAKDNNGIAVLQIATDHGYEGIVEILKHYRETDNNGEMDNFWWRIGPKHTRPIKPPPGGIPTIILLSPKNGTMGAKASDLIIVEGAIGDPTINTAKLFLNGVPIPLKVVNGRFRREISLPDTRVTTFRVMATGKNGQTGYSTLSVVLIGDHINLWNPRSY